MAACAGASGAGRPLVMMAVLGVLWGGACFGFNGIKRVLLIEGLFLDACDGGEARCGAQLDRLDFAWTFSSSMLNVFAIVNGCAIDALGLRRVCFLSGGLLGFGAVCFGLVVTRARLEYLLAYAYFALVESGQEKGDSTSLQRECSARARSGKSIQAASALRGMTARPKISRNEWRK